ncbi:hypothetical protein RJ639_025867, partial [Escallonia herrerae]
MDNSRFLLKGRGVTFLFDNIMNLMCLVSVLLLVAGVLSRENSQPDVVNIGAILSFGTVNGRIARIAMNAAVRDVNSNPSVLAGRKLRHRRFPRSSFDIPSAKCLLSLVEYYPPNNFDAFGTALEFLETDTVAIIGPQSSVMAHVLSHLANELHVPLLSFTALDPTLSPLQYPYFIQTAPSDLYQMTAIAYMVSYYGYREVTAVFIDEDQFRNGITTLGNELAKRRCKISYEAAISPGQSLTQEDVVNELVRARSMESRVFVLNAYAQTGRLILDVAQSLGMMEKGYVWIATTWLSTVLDSTSISPKNANSTNGVLTLCPHMPDSERKIAFASRWHQLSNGSVGLNPYGLYAYDTVWLIASAVNSFLYNGGTISFSKDSRLSRFSGGGFNLGALSIFYGGKQLLNYVLQTNMTANRSLSSQNLSSVVWPGDTGVQPRGWVFPHNGRRLRIGVPDRVSYQDFVSQVNGTNIVQGYCIDAFLAATKVLPYAVPYKFILFGDGYKNPSYSEFVNKVTSNVFDAAVGDIAIVTNRTRVVDFTQPYIVWSSDCHTNDEVELECLGFLASIYSTNVGCHGNFFPICGSERINEEFRGPPKKQIVTILRSFAENYLSEELNIAKSRLLSLGSPEAYADALDRGSVAAVVDERPYVHLFLAKHCRFQMAFPRDSPLAVDMSTAILTLSENGELQKIHDKWLKRRRCSSQGSSLGSEQLHLSSFWGLFLVCGVACFLALLVYFYLMIRRFKRHYAEVSGPSWHGGSPSVCLQRFLSFADEKE